MPESSASEFPYIQTILVYLLSVTAQPALCGFFKCQRVGVRLNFRREESGKVICVLSDRVGGES
jgi:hypothetical protein